MNWEVGTRARFLLPVQDCGSFPALGEEGTCFADQPVAVRAADRAGTVGGALIN